MIILGTKPNFAHIKQMVFLFDLSQMLANGFMGLIIKAFGPDLLHMQRELMRNWRYTQIKLNLNVVQRLNFPK